MGGCASDQQSSFACDEGARETCALAGMNTRDEVRCDCCAILRHGELDPTGI
jgi:hypothetical protein